MKKETASKNPKDDKQKILDRISRIEGQLRGIRKMIEGDMGCLDIITQISAVKEAVSRIGVEMLKKDFCKIDLKNKAGEKYIETLFKIK